MRSGIAPAKILILILVVFSLYALMLMGCACPGRYKNPNDPFENYNRSAFAFNMTLDKVLLRPTARIYTQVLPQPIRHGINNVYSNFDLIPTIANDILQLRVHRTFSDSWRLLLNTTVGIGGIFDVATSAGLPEQPNDFGLTLARWGYRHSTYLVIPILGPSTTRDSVGYFVDLQLLSIWPYIHPVALRYSLFAVGKVRKRANLLNYDKLLYDSFDPYVFMRDAYLQQRNNLIIQMNGPLKNEMNNQSKDDVNKAENIKDD